MFWVLQKNLFHEAAFQELLHQLERQETKYQIVNLIPFIHEMEPDIDVADHVYVCGSTGIGKVAKKKGWVPGYFDKNLDYAIVKDAYGEDCLNYHSKVVTLRAASRELLKDPTANFFVRPCADNKSFSGTVMGWEDFSQWRDKVVALEKEENSLTTLQPDDRIIIAPLAKIYSETRFYVVDGEVVTGSQYKAGDTVYYTSEVMPFIEQFAQKMVNKWQPDRAFVLDIADTDEGPKVIEINAINSSGFYACDMGKYVNAINSMTF